MSDVWIAKNHLEHAYHKPRYYNKWRKINEVQQAAHGHKKLEEIAMPKRVSYLFFYLTHFGLLLRLGIHRTFNVDYDHELFFFSISDSSYDCSSLP